MRNQYTENFYCPGLSSLGDGTHILADQLTLFQPGGTDYDHLITTGTPGFSDLPTVLLSLGWKLEGNVLKHFFKIKTKAKISEIKPHSTCKLVILEFLNQSTFAISHLVAIKVQVLWNCHKNLKRSPSNVKTCWRFFLILWPSHNVLTLWVLQKYLLRL